MSKPEPSEARAADAILKDLRGRRFLKYVFDDDPANCLPYGYLEAPIDLETQREIAETLARNALSAASVAGMPSREEVARIIDPKAAECAHNVANGIVRMIDSKNPRSPKFDYWKNAWSNWAKNDWERALTKADAILALFASPSDGGGNG